MTNNHRKYVVAPRDLAAAHSRSADVIEDRCKELTITRAHELGDHAAMYISAAVLRALAIELALKSLCYAESSTVCKEHGLQQLFDKLTTQSQQGIENAAQNDLTRRFRDVLSEISDVFVVWRYVHERFGEGKGLGFQTDEMRVVVHAVLRVLDDRIKSIT